jgi:hypothetical protein
VAKKSKKFLDFEIDKLTNSIENTISGDSLPTNVALLEKGDLKLTLRKQDWVFDWKSESKKKDRQVYKLTVQNNPQVIQGLLSLTIKADHIYMNLLESAPFNKGSHKIYRGVPGNLVAFACKMSLEGGFEGVLSFHSKTRLILHYEKTLGAVHVGGHLMILQGTASLKLVAKYFFK